jgi:hypothetical protein
MRRGEIKTQAVREFYGSSPQCGTSVPPREGGSDQSPRWVGGVRTWGLHGLCRLLPHMTTSTGFP